ncbi:MAG: rod shape-determining protein MreC, partial [Oscillospiraceae bacterium]
MKEFLRSIKFKIIVGLLVILAGFMIYSGTVEGFDVMPSRIIGFLVTPFQQVSSAISGNVGDFFNKFMQADEIKKENEQLKEEINKLRGQMSDFDSIKQQNDRYKDFIGLKEENPEMVFEEASVVERDPNSQFYSFKIDKGSIHGVEYR